MVAVSLRWLYGVDSEVELATRSKWGMAQIQTQPQITICDVVVALNTVAAANGVAVRIANRLISSGMTRSLARETFNSNGLRYNSISGSYDAD